MYTIYNLSEMPELKRCAAEWFHEKWGIPAEAYLESMDEMFRDEKAVPQWYLALDEGRIVGGSGVIENDFHERKDLAPNVCAVYVEPSHRCQGIAGKLLDFVCTDMRKRGIATLYLMTDHTSFYERYNWEFLDMVKGDDGSMSRMYVHNTNER